MGRRHCSLIGGRATVLLRTLSAVSTGSRSCWSRSSLPSASASSGADRRPVPRHPRGPGRRAARRTRASRRRSVLAGTPWAAQLGERATLLQFSSAFCAPCRATRRVLERRRVQVTGRRAHRGRRRAPPRRRTPPRDPAHPHDPRARAARRRGDPCRPGRRPKQQVLAALGRSGPDAFSGRRKRSISSRSASTISRARSRACGLGLPAELAVRLGRRRRSARRPRTGARSCSSNRTWSSQSRPACAKAASQNSRTVWPSPVASTKSSGSSCWSIRHMPSTYSGA